MQDIHANKHVNRTYVSHHNPTKGRGDKKPYVTKSKKKKRKSSVEEGDSKPKRSRKEVHIFLIEKLGIKSFYIINVLSLVHISLLRRVSTCPFLNVNGTGPRQAGQHGQEKSISTQRRNETTVLLNNNQTIEKSNN